MFSFSDSLGVITGLSIPANQQNEKAHGAKSINGLLLLQLLFKYICIFESVASFQDSSPSGVTQDVLNPSPNKLCLIVWNVANQESSLETQYLDFFFFFFFTESLSYGHPCLACTRISNSQKECRGLHNYIVCKNSWDTVNLSYQSMVGILLESKFPDANEGPTLPAVLFKYKQSGVLC